MYVQNLIKIKVRVCILLQNFQEEDRGRIENPTFSTNFFPKFHKGGGALMPKNFIFSKTFRNAFKKLIIEYFEIFKRVSALISSKFVLT